MIRIYKVFSLLVFCSAMVAGSESCTDYQDVESAPNSSASHQVSANRKDSVWVESIEAYHPSVSLLRDYFVKASEEFDVPAQLLMAIGAIESNWTQMPRPSIDQGWGIMHLSDNGNCNTLSLAAELLDADKKDLKSSAKLNIRGAAAVLDRYAIESGINKDSLDEWIIPIAAFSCLIDSDLRSKQAHEYMRVVKNGYKAPTIWGDTIVITPK